MPKRTCRKRLVSLPLRCHAMDARGLSRVPKGSCQFPGLENQSLGGEPLLGALGRVIAGRAARSPPVRPRGSAGASPRSLVYYSVRGRSSRYPSIKPRWTPRCGASVGAPLAAGCPRMSARRCSLARPPASPVIVFTVRGKTFIDTIDERDSIPPLPLLHDHPSGAARGSSSAPCSIVATGDPRGPLRATRGGVREADSPLDERESPFWKDSKLRTETPV